MSVICRSHMTVFMRNFALVTEGAVGCRLWTNCVTETGVEDSGGGRHWGGRQWGWKTVGWKTVGVEDSEGGRQWGWKTVRVEDSEGGRQWGWKTVGVEDSEGGRQWGWKTVRVEDSGGGRQWGWKTVGVEDSEGGRQWGWKTVGVWYDGGYIPHMTSCVSCVSNLFTLVSWTFVINNCVQPLWTWWHRRQTPDCSCLTRENVRELGWMSPD